MTNNTKFWIFINDVDADESCLGQISEVCESDEEIEEYISYFKENMTSKKIESTRYQIVRVVDSSPERISEIFYFKDDEIERKKSRTIKKGTQIVITAEEYSDYRIVGTYTANSDIDLDYYESLKEIEDIGDLVFYLTSIRVLSKVCFTELNGTNPGGGVRLDIRDIDS